MSSARITAAALLALSAAAWSVGATCAATRGPDAHAADASTRHSTMSRRAVARAVARQRGAEGVGRI